MPAATSRQAEAWNRRLDANEQWVPDGYDDLDTSVAPNNALNLLIPCVTPYQTAPIAPGTITVLSYTCPSGLKAFIQNLFIIYVGGGFQQGDGSIIFSVLRNGVEAGKGFGQLFQTMGTQEIPYVLQKAIQLVENDVFTILATVPGPNQPAGTIGAQAAGFLTPIVQGGYAAN